MMLQVNCRGFAVAQHLQPEPAKYSHAPNLEARTFMQPEQPYYAHHPGRFVYVKDEESGLLSSVPYEPVRKQAENFLFSVGQSDIYWALTEANLEIEWSVGLPVDDALELWSLKVRNRGDRRRTLSLYPCFTIGYMSWMNQSARYRPELGGIVASSVTPYQKLEDFEAVRRMKDLTFLLHDHPPAAWETAREAFEGEGGLHCPDAIISELLAGGDAVYETPVGVLQYRPDLAPGEEQEYRFVFGPARDDEEIESYRNGYLAAGGFEASAEAYRSYMDSGRGCLSIRTPDPDLDHFVNHWLGRQVFYHGDVNRLSTDPQTRNFLQDHMGMSWFDPDTARSSFIHALRQQEPGGAMPDGILLHEDARLSYINQVPHTDHCVWLPVCLRAYLDETNDNALLDELVAGDSDDSALSVFDRVTAAMRWLISRRDDRGLSYIDQGDWCDPMNMVGHKGRGVSGWLSLATVYALNLWAEICRQREHPDLAEEMRGAAAEIGGAVQQHLWDGDWFGRGITDDGVLFGTREDEEGRIFLNPQSWAILAGVASQEQQKRMFKAVAEQLETPFGVMMLAPSYTRLRDDIGRVTQKHPGSAENGSVYNHAAIFYVFSLYRADRADHAFRLFRQMIPGPDTDDYLQRGQLPVFVPNYYRGAWHQFPRTAGRSSQLFNTGTAAWMYRTLVEGLFGVRGCAGGLSIRPQLPSHWESAAITRQFRGCRYDIEFLRDPAADGIRIEVDGQRIEGDTLEAGSPGQQYAVTVTLPGAAQ